MQYGKRLSFWGLGLSGLAVLLVGGRFVQSGGGIPGSIVSWLEVALQLIVVFVGLAGALFLIYLVVGSIGTRRRDKVTRTAITANQPEALVVYVAQTADSRKALEAFDRNRVLEWAAALAVTSAGVSLWQSPRAGSSERLFNLRWSEIQQVRIVMIPVGLYKTAALELSSVVKPEHHLIVPFNVRPRSGSVIGLGLGPRIGAIEAKIQGLRGASR